MPEDKPKRMWHPPAEEWEKAVAWARQVIENDLNNPSTKPRVMWFRDKGGHKYHIDHKNKRITLMNPEVLLEVQPGCVIHQKTVDTFAAVGYEVVVLGMPEAQIAEGQIAEGQDRHALVSLAEFRNRVMNLRCECRNRNFAGGFIYMDAGDVHTAGCKCCGRVFEFQPKDKSWKLVHRPPVNN